MEGVPRFHIGREQVLDRLWELANLGAEVTRGSITGQIKAISIIVAIEGMVPDRRAGSAQTNPAHQPPKPEMYVSAWRRKQQEDAADAQPNPDAAQEDQKEDELGIPRAESASGSVEDTPPAPDPASVFNPAEPTFADRVRLKETQWVPDTAFERDTRVPFSIKTGSFPGAAVEEIEPMHSLQRFRNWCKPKPRTFSWFSPKENHSSRSLTGHSNCETAQMRQNPKKDRILSNFMKKDDLSTSNRGV